MNDLLNFSMIPANKSEQNAMAAECVKNILEGNVDTLQAVVQAKSINEVTSLFLKDDRVREMVINECGKYDKNERATFRGAEVTVKESGVKYNFTECNDVIYSQLVEDLLSLTSKVKEREKFLKAVTKPLTAIDEETGEVYTILPPSKSSTTTFAVSFKSDSNV